ncbi:hypothetical protein CFC21_034959 [Triticum aestivum]|uniref:Uncharacterized protein n=2 Tax=Triticum aestivum TaxID=4565 RepID=A0A9R1F4K5_WHEAT|nr:hypothetical protein CFC21_034958 [Triticum aestivum]KAF7022128.1 hypothetical protein CFC21_034959 [Triticum aestivum]
MASPSSGYVDASSRLRPRAARPPHRQHPCLPHLSSSTSTASLTRARPVLCIASYRRRKVWAVPDLAALASCPAPRAPSSSSPPRHGTLQQGTTATLTCTRASLTGGVVLDRRQHCCPACVLDLLLPRAVKFRELLLFFFCCCISVRLQATASDVCDACCCHWMPRPPRHLNFVSLFAARLPSFSPSTTSS